MCGLLPSTESAGHLPVWCVWKERIDAVTAIISQPALRALER